MDLIFEELPENDIASRVHKLIKPHPHLNDLIIEKNTGMVIPRVYKQHAQRLLDFEVREDDIWMLAHMKSGTTWCTELLWYLMNLDHLQEAVDAKMKSRFHYLEFYGIDFEDRSLDELAATPSPRLIKSHFHKELLPRQIWCKEPKIIYLARNPKDVAVSLYYHYKNMYSYSGSLDLLLESFYQERKIFGSYWKHVLDFWDLRHEENILFLTYEEMSSNLEGVIRRISAHVNVPVSEDVMKRLLELLQMDTMRETRNRMLDGCGEKNYWRNFVREGKPGAGRTQMTLQMQENFDKWTRESLAQSDLDVESLLA